MEEHGKSRKRMIPEGFWTVLIVLGAMIVLAGGTLSAIYEPVPTDPRPLLVGGLLVGGSLASLGVIGYFSCCLIYGVSAMD